MSVSTTLITVEEYSQLPKPKGGHYELHHGELKLMTAPKWGHTQIQKRLERLLEQAVGNAGLVMMEMPFRPAAEYEVWVTDVGVVLNARATATASDDYLQGAPDLMIEGLSPSNTVDEINEKMAVAFASGCESFWVVDPKRKEIAVTEGDITRRYKPGTVITSKIVSGIEAGAVFLT